MTERPQRLDEATILRVERDSAVRMVDEKRAYIEHLESELKAARDARSTAEAALEPLRRERDIVQRQNQELVAQLATLERLRRWYRRVPGGAHMARLLKRSLH